MLEFADRPVDWHRVIGGLFHVRSGAARPPEAFTSVRYRGHWFWIADEDLETKTTFNLLSYLFALQADSGEVLAPLVTVSAGG